MNRIPEKEFHAIANKGIYLIFSIETKDEEWKAHVEHYLNTIRNCTLFKKDFRRISFTYTDTKTHSDFFKYGPYLVTAKPKGEGLTELFVLLTEEAKDPVKKQIDPDKIIDCLPSGSGIDYEWEYTVFKNGKVEFRNAFHAMNKHGYYDGVMPFKFTLEYNPVTDTLSYNRIICDENRRKSFFGLRDYLEDAISYSLHVIKPEWVTYTDDPEE